MTTACGGTVKSQIAISAVHAGAREWYRALEGNCRALARNLRSQARILKLRERMARAEDAPATAAMLHDDRRFALLEARNEMRWARRYQKGGAR